MKKKLLALIIAGVTAMQLVACGAAGGAKEASDPAQSEAVAESSTAQTVQIANPWHDITYEEARESIPNLFKLPDGATNEKWSMMGEADTDKIPGVLIQATFDLDGMSYVAREQVTGDTKEDISGLYYEWDVSLDSTLQNWGGGNMTGTSYRHIGGNETIDLFTWYDVEIGLTYALSTSGEDLDGYDIQAIVEQMHDPSTEFGYEN